MPAQSRRLPESETGSPKQNHLLAALPGPDYERLRPHLKRVPMALDETLYKAGRRARHVYFPTTSIVSLLHVMEDGTPAEMAVVGNEGILGVSLFMGCDTTPSRAIVHSEGYGYRLQAQLLEQEFRRAGPMLHLLLRYIRALITQMAQTAVCNRHHTVEQQLCRWLLLTLDRLPSNELSANRKRIVITPEARREGISKAADNLQRAGLIRCSRDRITVLEPSRLEHEVCECYPWISLCYRMMAITSAAPPCSTAPGSTY